MDQQVDTDRITIDTGTTELLCHIEALAMGLVNRVFAKPNFQAEAFAYARALANGPTAALGRMKLNLNRGVDQSLGASLALEARHMIESGGTAESREAIRAFMEKRAPVFHG